MSIESRPNFDCFTKDDYGRWRESRKVEKKLPFAGVLYSFFMTTHELGVEPAQKAAVTAYAGNGTRKCKQNFIQISEEITEALLTTPKGTALWHLAISTFEVQKEPTMAASLERLFAIEKVLDTFDERIALELILQSGRLIRGV